MTATKNPYASKRKAVGIKLSQEVIEYFKTLSIHNGIPYQMLINLYLSEFLHLLLFGCTIVNNQNANVFLIHGRLFDVLRTA